MEPQTAVQAVAASPQQGFDTRAPFTVVILSGTEKSCELRFPTDKEWCDRSRRQRIIHRDLGRGKTTRDVPRIERIDHELFASIARPEDVDKFDEYEASKAIGRLSRADVTDVQRDGNRFRIELKVFGGAFVTHILKIPTEQDVVEYGRASVKVTDARHTREIRIALEPAAEIWEKLKVETSGYAEGGSVPIVHKDAALVEAFAKKQEIEEADPEA